MELTEQNYKEEFNNKCKKDERVIFEDKFQIQIKNKTYNFNIFANEISEVGMKSYIKAIESVIHA